jgi:N-acetylglucosamine-6-phosphate deacetylase
MIAIQAGQIPTPLKSISPGVILIEGRRIVDVGHPGEVPLPAGTEIRDFQDKVVVPGFIDTHTHGRDGDYFGEDKEATGRLCRNITRTGVTSLLPTLASLMPIHYTLAMMLERIDTVRQVMAQDAGGAEILGMHLEGPFLSSADTARGSQLVVNLRKASVRELQQMAEAAEGTIRKMSIAPELEGALDVIREMIKLNIVPCAGHSTATYEQAMEAVHAGLCCGTHVFNGMIPFHHRRPGLLGAVLTCDRINAELIADGQHVSAAAMKLLLRCKGVDGVHLITDNTIWAGMANGTYQDGDRSIVKEESRAYVLGGTLVGSVAPMNLCVGNMVRFVGCSLGEAVKMASLNPAVVVGEADRKGSLERGKDADLVVVDEEVEVYVTMVKGQEVYRAGESRRET